VLRAWCLDETGAAAGATDALDQALECARRDRLVLPFTHVPGSLLERHARTVPGLRRLADRLREARTRSPYDVVDELPALTPREVAVLEALARGLSLEEVGRELFVSRNTVKTQASSLYRKLQVSGRAEAVRKANRIGLLD
jgi:LuxR family maltose regulon positive regulatory protein